MCRFPLLFKLCAVACLGAVSGRALVVTYTATGSIVLIANNFTDTIHLGDTFSYTFSYDPDSTPNVSVGSYKQIKLISAEVSVMNSGGAVVWSSPGNFTFDKYDRTLTLQNQSNDRIAISSNVLDAAPGLNGAGFMAGNTFAPVFASIVLNGAYTVLPSTTVPTFLNLADWYGYNDIDPASALVLSFNASGGGNFVIRGSIDTLQAAAIPEPSTTAAVLGAAGLGCAALMRRRKVAAV